MLVGVAGFLGGLPYYSVPHDLPTTIQPDGKNRWTIRSRVCCHSTSFLVTVYPRTFMMRFKSDPFHGG